MTGGGGLGRSGGVFAALPMPLGSDSDLGLAGPNGTPEMAELPAPAEPAGGVNCANAPAGASRTDATSQTKARLRSITGSLEQYRSNDHIACGFPRPESSVRGVDQIAVFAAARTAME